jgi:hypothetical protein
MGGRHGRSDARRYIGTVFLGGGHFAAMEGPQLLVEDVRGFVGQLAR